MFSLLRGSGLKYNAWVTNKNGVRVLPLTREWIEIVTVNIICCPVNVLPLTREWIEIVEKLK